MNRSVAAMAFVLLLAPLTGFAAKPIGNLVDVPVPVRVDGSAFSAEDVQAAIISGCLARGWAPVLDSDGLIRATINVRAKHFAEIEIPFSATSYSILYKSSENLDYDAKRQRIHRNYNNWVVNLSKTIQRDLLGLQASR
jgi:hypothetical protein